MKSSFLIKKNRFLPSIPSKVTVFGLEDMIDHASAKLIVEVSTTINVIMRICLSIFKNA